VEPVHLLREARWERAGLNSNKLVVQTLLAGQTHLATIAMITTVGARVAQSQTAIMQAMVQKRTAVLAANRPQHRPQQVQEQTTAAAIRRARIRCGRQVRPMAMGHAATRSHGCSRMKQG